MSTASKHLYRKHSFPKFSCPRCSRPFETQADLQAHARSTYACEVRELEALGVITQDQEMRLRSRKKTSEKDLTEAEKWTRVYGILFPDVREREIPSPYFNSEDAETNFCGYEDYLRREPPPLVRQQLEQEMDHEFGVLELRTKRMVFIVTGSSGGLGKELAKILYSKNAKVYLAARSETKTMAVVSELKELYPESRGHCEYLHLDLSDLTTIKQSAQNFLDKESRLDVLWNNAGVMTPPQGSKTAQGYELQLGVNVLGPFLFTHVLRPALSAAAKDAPKDSVRVVWLSSGTAAGAPKPAVDFSNINYAKDEGAWTKYSRSKAGNVVIAAEFARRTAGEGIISMSVDPGVYLTDLQRTMPWYLKVIAKILSRDPMNGAYTELFAGLSPVVTGANNGGWIIPFGRLASGRADLLEKELGKKYWEWAEEQIKPYIA
ncbi:hypothetical protein EsH8_V_000995 [Colletotrichum jinshuiense]